MNQRLKAVRHVALDMDGTIYSGSTLFDATTPFLELLKELGIGYTFLTNNPSKRAGLEGYGLSISERIPLQTSPTKENIEYLRAKREKLGHILENLEPAAAAGDKAGGEA